MVEGFRGMKKKPISRKVLQTELGFALQLIDGHNLGYARSLIQDVLRRVNEYDLYKKEQKK